MKALFLVKEELKLPGVEFYSFVPYLYGPCSFEVYSDLYALQREGLVVVEQSVWGWKLYRLTKRGRAEAEKVINRLSPEVLSKLQEIAKLVSSKSFVELLQYIYDRYPEYARNSVINVKGLRG
jgi:DNA-binding PadR family transcriptional regulator